VTPAGALALSVVLPTDTWDTIHPVVERLRRQTVASTIEVVLVVPESGAASFARMPREGFGAVAVVTVEAILPLARARAAGVGAATAPLVFLGETHSYPQPTWAEAIVAAAAARDDIAVFVPVFGNANPNGALSWSAFLLDYGGWQDGHHGGEIDGVPIFNSVYRRRVLTEVADPGLALGHGDAMALHLRAHGHRALIVPAARLDHVNIAQRRAWIRERLSTGRLLAANRASVWGWARRIAYAGAFPLIAAVLARRALPSAYRHGGAAAPAGTVPAMLAAITLKAFGEALGYAGGGSPRVEESADEFELHKLSYAARDRR
jgi:hypothetical protein